MSGVRTCMPQHVQCWLVIKGRVCLLNACFMGVMRMYVTVLVAC